MPSLVDLFADKIAEAGVDVVFGLPGGENVDMLDSLRRHSVEFVLVRNESSAIFIADVQAALASHMPMLLEVMIDPQGYR